MARSLTSLVTIIACCCASLSWGAYTHVYQIADTSSYAFSYSGGLSGYQFDSSLVGTFQVTIPDSGPAFISAADIKIGALSPTSNLVGLNPPTDANLSNYLVDDLIGLPVINDSANYPFEDDRSLAELLQADSVTRFALDFTPGTSESQAQLTIASHRPNKLDGMVSSLIAPGLPVVRIPEPSTLLLGLGLFTALAIHKRRV
ncbi:PEP-CTERM sorting domain-containing protein [Aeoliella mucimassa]|uniref:Uncharacterized protein n=1 Tax=Aeoliella mucimassa TaxID=2527972 RepID=A0A518AU64_9BACT|nr:PEP-CTERM sorting domain-containing protein [Aeoliella mucimassa]QDU58257.1 hypothetical protein Pan181_44900 [Aeoliella mucimassa]